MNNSLFIFIIIFFNCFFIFFLRKLQNKIDIFDKPDGFRKLQKRAIPPIGGFIICFNVILIFFIMIVNNNLFLFEYSYFYENNKIILRSFFSFFLTSIILFIIGLYDDKLNIKPLLKVILLSLIYFTTILIDEKLIIENLIFFSFNKIIYLNKFSFILRTTSGFLVSLATSTIILSQSSLGKFATISQKSFFDKSSGRSANKDFGSIFFSDFTTQDLIS